MNNTRMLLLLALLSAFPPLSTDMYLPAIPLLVKLWQQPLALVNLTLVGFFVSYCFFLLFYGPLSDRFGRRPLLLAGIGLFILASILCALADGLIGMIVFRVLQAAGAAAASTLALAISKDIYAGHERARILAYSNNLVLEQVDRHAGAAASLLVFIYFMLGAFSMWLISLEWIDKIGVIGVLGTCAGGLLLSVWLLLPMIDRRSPAEA